jgi:thioredoxin 1
MKARTHGFNPEYSSDEPEPEEIGALPGRAVLEFGAPWCGHCRAAAPGVKELLSRNPELSHIKVHDGKGRPLGRAFGVKRWPTLILLRDGEEVARVVRPRTAAAIEQLLLQ